MKRQLCATFALWLATLPSAFAQTAVQVLSFDPGTTAVAGYDSLAAPLGAPANTNGGNMFEGVISPFNPSYKTADLISIGETGHLTLRLSHYVVPQAGAPEIGVFTHVGLADANYPNGQSDGSPTTFGVDVGNVEVSENGTTWVDLGGATFDIPTNAYTDLTDPYSLTNGSVLADYQKPFVGHLGDFANLSYSGASPNMLDLLDGSAGGKWLDISASGLAQVGFIRFSVPDSPALDISLELDAVTISRAALGGLTVPEPSTFFTVCSLLFCGAGRRFRRTDF